MYRHTTSRLRGPFSRRSRLLERPRLRNPHGGRRLLRDRNTHRPGFARPPRRSRRASTIRRPSGTPPWTGCCPVVSRRERGAPATGDSTQLRIFRQGLTSPARRYNDNQESFLILERRAFVSGRRHGRGVMQLPAVAVSQSPEDKFREYLSSRPAPSGSPTSSATWCGSFSASTTISTRTSSSTT